jgi:pimeloyl-ACP methyl ester carboxylesterase
MTQPARSERGLELPADVRFVDVRGTQLAYREHGAGQPVVFVHGSLCDLTFWDQQLSDLGDQFRVIAYSRRYAWPNEDLRVGTLDMMQPHVDDLLAFLQKVDAYPAHVVGNSWGAFIALRAAIQDPAAVSRLVLEEPPLVPLVTGAPPSPLAIARSLARRPRLTFTTIRFAARTIGPMTKQAKAGQTEASIERFMRGVLGDSWFDRLPPEFKQHASVHASTHLGQALADGGFEPLAEADVRAVSAPALIVRGSDSPPLLRQLMDVLAGLLPNSILIDIPQASHIMNVQNPATLNAELRRFLA